MSHPSLFVVLTPPTVELDAFIFTPNDYYKVVG